MTSKETRTSALDPVCPVIFKPEDVVVRIIDDRLSARHRVAAFGLDFIVDIPIQAFTICLFGSR